MGAESKGTFHGNAKIYTQRQNQLAVSWEEAFLKFYRFFQIIQTWSASDHIFVSFHVLASVWEFIFLMKTEWVIPRRGWLICCQALAKYKIFSHCPTEKQVGLAKAWAITYHSDKHITCRDGYWKGFVIERTCAKTAIDKERKEHFELPAYRKQKMASKLLLGMCVE